MENSEQTEQENPTNSTGHHPATHPATTRIKKNRRFVRISNRREWKLKKEIQKEIEMGKKTVLNLSNRHSIDADYRLLGKGLKYCIKPKPHSTLQCKQDIFTFARKLRLKEYFFK